METEVIIMRTGIKIPGGSRGGPAPRPLPSEPPSQPSGSDPVMGKVKKIRQLDFQNHCLFCLRPQDPGTLLEVAGRDPQGLSSDLQPIVNYLTGGGWGKEEDYDKEDGAPVIKIPGNLPPVVCPACHRILAELYRLHRELLRIQGLIQKQTEMARREIVARNQTQEGTSSSAREGFYFKICASGGGMSSEEEVTAVMELVDKLHDKIVLEASGNKKVRFPGRVSVPQFLTLVPPPTVSSETVPINEEIDDDDADEIQGRNLYVELDLEDLVAEDEDMEAHSPGSRSPPQISDEEEQYTPSFEKHLSSAVPSPCPPPKQRKRKHAFDEEPDLPPFSQAATVKPSSPSKGITSAPQSRDTGKPTPATGPKRRRNRYQASKYQKRPTLILPLVENGNGSTSQYCDLCKELCPSSEIRGHLETQHNVGDFIVQCPIPSCPYVFSCRGKLERHLTVNPRQPSICSLKAKPHSMTPPIKCEVCGFQTKLKTEFREHLKKTHEGDSEKTISCPISPCQRKFVCRQSLEDHLYDHDYEDEVRRKSGLKPDTGILQNCDLCGESTPVAQIVSHLEDVHHVKDYITRCPNPSCPKVFSCHGKMENHLGLTAPGYKTSPCRIAAKLPDTRPGKKCDTCGVEVFRHKFQHHLQLHECQAGEKTLLCPIPGCPERYALRQSMEEHLLIHDFRPPKQGAQECSVCKEMIPVDKIESHLMEAHEVVEVIPCRRCPFRFHDWEPLLDHMSEHRLRSQSQGGGPYSCDLCNDDNEPAMKFLRYEQLRMHFFAVHQIGKKFLCESCELEFFSREGLSSHQKKRHGDKPTTSTKAANPNKKTYKCDLCPGIVFLTQDSLLTHKTREHGAPPPTCFFCGKLFKSHYTLRKHERTHKGLDITLKCSVANCNRKFRTRADLKDHERGGHRDPLLPKLYMCEACGKGFNTPFNLNLHMKNMHSDKKGPRPRRICETCGESFSSSQTLRRHTLYMHTAERPPRRPLHQCPIPGCGWTSRVKRDFQRHLKSHERKET